MIKKKASVGPSGPLAKTDYERLAELRYRLRRFLIFSENVAEQAGLTAQQHQVLLAIKAIPVATRSRSANWPSGSVSAMRAPSV